MSASSIRHHWSILISLVFAAALAGIGPVRAQGPFQSLAGNWSGNGSVTVSNGANEPIRCRAEYRVGNAGTSVVLQLRCASDSYKFELQGDVSYKNGEVRGNWSESTRGTAGRVVGAIKGDKIDVRVDGQTFAALLSLTTRGDKQSISIRTPGGGEMKEANITLSRRG